MFTVLSNLYDPKQLSSSRDRIELTHLLEQSSIYVRIVGLPPRGRPVLWKDNVNSSVQLYDY